MSFQFGVLHNRKTAGTALFTAIEQQKSKDPHFPVQCFGHAMTLPQFLKEHPKAKAIFFVREPLSRFISGFYSRLRQGQPRYFFPWTKDETLAFTQFTTPNELAEALSAADKKRRKAAIFAMRSIGHVKHTYVDFLGKLTFLEKNKTRIAFIGHQIEFDKDFHYLRQLLNIHTDIHPPSDDVGAHRNPSDLDKTLSALAQENLHTWYEKDLAIYTWCLQFRTQLLNPC